MTTTQPPLKPGDRVLVEAVARADDAGDTVLDLVPVDPDHVPWRGQLLDPSWHRWHPMPAEDSPDAAHVAQLEAERDEALRALRCVRHERVISIVFGHHPGAPRPFALWRNDGLRVLAALGAEFPDGAVALRLANDGGWTTKSSGFAEQFAAEGLNTEIVWLSEELEPLAEMERQRDAALAERDALRKVYDAAEALVAANESTATVAFGNLYHSLNACRAGQKAPETALPSSTCPHGMPGGLRFHRQLPGVVCPRCRAEKAPADAPSATRSDAKAETVPDSAEPSTEPTEASTAARYAALCREVALLADKTMNLAKYTHAAGTNPTHVGDLENTARAMLALIPDVPPTVCEYGGQCPPGECIGPCDPPRYGRAVWEEVTTAAQPQPTDAPGRRDWAGEFARALDEMPIDWDVFTGDKQQVIDHLATALRLDELGETYAELATALQRLDEHNGEIGSPGQAVAWVLRDLAEARKERDAARLAHDNAKWLIDGQNQEIEYLRNQASKPGCAQAHEDLAEAAGKYDALRAGALSVADALDAAPADLDPIVRRHLDKQADRLRALAAPPTTTPDGTDTAKDGSEGGDHATA